MTVVDLAGVLAAINARPAYNGIRIVGVDGPSGSGKSTLARAIAELAGAATVIAIDDFVGWDDLTGWWPRFDAHVLRPLRAGRDARYQVRDWVGDEFGRSLGEWRVVRRAPLIVLEGVTCTRIAAAPALAYAIWVQAPDGMRLDRGLARDGGGHLGCWRRWMALEREFFTADGTAARADLRLSTAMPGPPVVLP